MSNIDWVESGGGPLLLVDVQTALDWHGVSEQNLSQEMTDYDRACAVTTDLEVLDAGSGEILVLGAEPMPTTWWSFENWNLLVRWAAAVSEEEVARRIKNIQESDFNDTLITLSIVSEQVLLFDSAYSGKEVVEIVRKLGEIPHRFAQKKQFVPGTYKIYYYEISDNSVNVLLYLLRM